ncbi:MAG: hypothetical protein P8Y53_13285 [Pseudolabrys sp.]
MKDEIKIARLRFHIALIGIGVSILLLWNGVCDYIYGYNPKLSGLDYFSPAVSSTILSANGRPHWMLLLAQTAGWLYPIYALTYYHWWLGMRRAGFWLGHLPLILLAYALLMIGGIQHAGWAFLSWFVVASPLGVLIITMIVGALLPAPYAGLVLAPFGTWFMLIPNIAGAAWLWKHVDALAPGAINRSGSSRRGPM